MQILVFSLPLKNIGVSQKIKLNSSNKYVIYIVFKRHALVYLCFRIDNIIGAWAYT